MTAYVCPSHGLVKGPVQGVCPVCGSRTQMAPPSWPAHDPLGESRLGPARGLVDLVAVDPGKRALGVALFCAGQLQACDLVKPSGRVHPEAVADALALWVHETYGPSGAPFLLVEKPQHYQGKRAVLQGVQALEDVVWAIQRRMDYPGRMWRAVHPMAWKANVAKSVHHARARLALTQEEAPLWPRSVQRDSTGKGAEDVRDAIALGLWGLGRLSTGKTPGGRGPSLDLPDL